MSCDEKMIFKLFTFVRFYPKFVIINMKGHNHIKAVFVVLIMIFLSRMTVYNLSSKPRQILKFMWHQH